MRSSSTEAQFCPNPKIIAGRLIAMRNIYLREELRNIAKGIQEHYQERLPVLPLVSLAAYEQIFQRQVFHRMKETNSIISLFITAIMPSRRTSTRCRQIRIRIL